jgi:hypothetical protein
LEGEAGVDRFPAAAVGGGVEAEAGQRQFRGGELG